MLQAFTLMFTLGLVVAGARLLVKSAQPGQSERASLIVIGMLFLAFLIAACAILIAASPGTWGVLIFGPQWSSCLLCIPLFAVAPFAALFRAVRRGAPTRLARNGGAAARPRPAWPRTDRPNNPLHLVLPQQLSKCLR